nr:hypothetical protein [Tanacetum cinerariifolium]
MMIKEIDQDDEIALDANIQERKTDDEMFRVYALTREEVVTIIADKVSAAPTTDDKGKAKMIEPEVPIKKKDQMRTDKEYARQVEAEEQEAAMLSRAQEDEEANISWYNIQAIMKADSLLAERLQARKREEFCIDSKAQKSSVKEAQENCTKRTTKSLESDISKKHKVDENVESVIDDIEELKTCMEIVPDDGDKAIVKDRFKKEKLVKDMDNLLFKTLKTMFEHHVEDTIWTYQQELAKVMNWKLLESCRVYYISMQSIIYYLLVKK